MLNWQNIDTILLDMDGTLLDLHFDNFFWLEHLPRRYAEDKSVSLEAAREFLGGLSEALYGSLDWYCLDHWTRAIDMDIEALKQEVRHRIRFRPGTGEFLRFLKSMNKQIILVTNAHPQALELKVTSSGLNRHLKKMISSHEFKLAKENTGFWLALAQREKLDLSRSLLIDDSLPVLRCARAEGIGMALQVLQPDMTLAPVAAQEFPGIVDFTELMQIPVHG